MSKQLYIGLMSGTSMDAIDACLVDFSEEHLKLLATYAEPISVDLKQEIIALCTPGPNAINRMGAVDVKLGRLFASTCLNLLDHNNQNTNEISAIGSHGQTIRHNPNGKYPFTLQIADPNIIAAKTDITTVADFRRRDMALGGQAAPLAPAFHRYLFSNEREDCWVLNIGGIANLTYLPANRNRSIIGFDTGPGNTLLDTWCFKHTGKPFDDGGQWAANGEIILELLAHLLHDPYFKKPAPKSTGREYFNLTWLEHYLEKKNAAYRPEDIQATLLELTAKTISDAIKATSKHATTVWLCGGGANNALLAERLAIYCDRAEFKSTAAIGIHPDWLEACAFAWFAKQTIEGKTSNITSVTGACRSSILGAIYPCSQ